MSWKYVMRMCGDTLEECIEIARIAEYEFVLWNGVVYVVLTCGWKETKLTISDLY